MRAIIQNSESFTEGEQWVIQVAQVRQATIEARYLLTQESGYQDLEFWGTVS